MTERPLEHAVEDFISRLNGVIDASINTDIRFAAEFFEADERAIVQVPIPANRRSPGLPLVRRNDDSQSPRLFLRAQYRVEMDDTNAYLQVITSTVGLLVDVTGGHRDPRPLLRVEYDRRRSMPGRPAAHVHLHANSPELAWIYGSSRQPAPDLHALHFPVGGRRFRPTLEDFLLFLDRERIFTNWKPGWRAQVVESLAEWDRSQARATVRRYPEEAITQLEDLGYVMSRLGGASD